MGESVGPTARVVIVEPERRGRISPSTIGLGRRSAPGWRHFSGGISSGLAVRTNRRTRFGNTLRQRPQCGAHLTDVIVSPLGEGEVAAALTRYLAAVSEGDQETIKTRNAAKANTYLHHCNLRYLVIHSLGLP